MPFISRTKLNSMSDLISKQAETIKELQSQLDRLAEFQKPVTTAKKVVVDNSYETKIEAVKQHLLKYGNITSWEAIQNYKATRLSDIIYRLKRKGMNITTSRESNDKSIFVRYYYAPSVNFS